jgi:hypothetical protein
MNFPKIHSRENVKMLATHTQLVSQADECRCRRMLQRLEVVEADEHAMA